MATHTVTAIDPRITLFKSATASDTVVNNTGALLKICKVTTVTNGSVQTITPDLATVIEVKPGATSAALETAVYYVLDDGQTNTTVPGISVVSA